MVTHNHTRAHTRAPQQFREGTCRQPAPIENRAFIRDSEPAASPAVPRIRAGESAVLPAVQRIPAGEPVVLPAIRRIRASGAADSPPIYVRSGRTYTRIPPEAVIECLRTWAAERFRRGAPVLDRRELIEAFLLTKLAPLDHELFAMILLDTQRRLIEYIEVFRGTLDITTIYIREVVKTALAHNAAGVVLVHNHPSGRAEPSRADVVITHRLRECLATVDIRLFDHFIVGEGVASMAEMGLLAPGYV